MNDPNTYPPGWNKKRIQGVIDHYEQLSDEEGTAELDVTSDDSKVTMIAIPNGLLPAVRALIAESR